MYSLFVMRTRLQTEVKVVTMVIVSWIYRGKYNVIVSWIYRGKYNLSQDKRGYILDMFEMYVLQRATNGHSLKTVPYLQLCGLYFTYKEQDILHTLVLQLRHVLMGKLCPSPDKLALISPPWDSRGVLKFNTSWLHFFLAWKD